MDTNTNMDSNTNMVSNTNIDSNTNMDSNPPKQHRKPIYFKFTEEPGSNAINHINRLTNNFDPQYGIPIQFVTDLKNTLANSQSTLQGFLYAPTDPDITRQVIGKGGCYFHLTTHNCKIHFWGDKYPLIRAMKIISSRIRKYSN